jgi:hypothetical protein
MACVITARTIRRKYLLGFSLAQTTVGERTRERSVTSDASLPLSARAACSAATLGPVLRARRPVRLQRSLGGRASVRANHGKTIYT